MDFKINLLTTVTTLLASYTAWRKTRQEI